MQPDTLEKQLAQIATCLGIEDDSTNWKADFELAFAMVPHKSEILPTFALRYILQATAFAHISDSMRLELYDKASMAMMDWLASLTDNPSHPKRQCLAPSVPLRFYPAARDALLELCGLDPKQDLCFRLIQIAGNSLEETSKLLQMELEAVKGCWLTARVFIEDSLESSDDMLEFTLFEEAGLRPPAEVTRTLEQIRRRGGSLWEVAQTPEGLKRLETTARGIAHQPDDVDSLLQDSLLRMALPSGPIPEDSKRLNKYASSIMRNLANDRTRRRRKVIASDDADIERVSSAIPGQRQKGMDLHGMHPGEQNQEARQSLYRQTTMNLLRQLRNSNPELLDIAEVCYLLMPNDSEPKQAERLDISLAALKRHKVKVQTFFDAGFGQAGLNIGHYKNFSRERRVENLYQLIYPLLTDGPRLPRGGDYRSEMCEALNHLSTQSNSHHDILQSSYLLSSIKPKVLAERLGLTLAELSQKRSSAKEVLANHSEKLVRAKAIENLYQLIYPLLTEELGLSKGGDYECEVRLALSHLSAQSNTQAEILQSFYLPTSVKPKVLAQNLGITTTELSERRSDVKSELARLSAELARAEVVENLYELMYPILTNEIGLPKGPDYRHEMCLALSHLSTQSNTNNDILNSFYLPASVKPNILVEKLGVTDTDLSERQSNEKFKLAHLTAELVRAKA
jgi:hypothetical protein